MLKITSAKIEVFTVIDMVLMTEKGIRGGLTQVIRKNGVANNKYLPNYDDSKKTTYLEYLDANNLYGYAMNKKCYPLTDINELINQYLLMIS